MRLDQWLWAVRVFKTRANSADLIKGGHVEVNGQPCKPAREMKPGDLIVAKVGQLTRTLRFLAEPPSRVAAKLVAQFAEDLTPPEEYQKGRDPHFFPVKQRARGSGRPTKKERRELDEHDGL